MSKVASLEKGDGKLMRGFFQNKIGRAVLSMLILVVIMSAVLGGYLISRRIQVANNDLLLNYKKLQPIAVNEEILDEITYEDYYFGEEIGRVIVANHGAGITIRDNRYGFIKDYHQGVLYMVMDFKKEDLFAEIRSYLNPRFWLGGGREINVPATPFKRSLEECQQIGKLLQAQLYDEIVANKKNELIRSEEGTYFVN